MGWLSEPSATGRRPVLRRCRPHRPRQREIDVFLADGAHLDGRVEAISSKGRRTPRTTDSGALAPAVISTVSSPRNQAGSMSAAPSIKWAASPTRGPVPPAAGCSSCSGCPAPAHVGLARPSAAPPLAGSAWRSRCLPSAARRFAGNRCFSRPMIRLASSTDSVVCVR